jgi:predicted RNase H-like nuclease (RuvC/YqgF family)
MLTVDDQQIKQLEEKIEEAKRFNNRFKDEIDRQKRKITKFQEENEYLRKSG